MGGTLFSRIGDFLHGKRPWYKLPRLLAMPRLVEIRNELREKNLHDTEEPPMEIHSVPVKDGVREGRTIDGSWNDLRCPHMGAKGARFGRNFPLGETRPDLDRLLVPNPRVVSRELMTRSAFQPATILNLLAASWIQFMVHDWFVHKRGAKADAIEIPLADDDPWPARPMSVVRSVPDPPTVAGSTRPPAYANENSHWWDASQVYGCDAETTSRLRTGQFGKIRVHPDGRLELDAERDLEITGFGENGWVGLSMLHGLFALEHNYLCDLLRSKNPQANDDWLYAKARLINSALMAKIHTVEWTPAILPHPVIQIAMGANWDGLGGDLQDVFEFLNNDEVLGGIVGSPADHHTAPYSLTEEFVSVYRMHALMPDEFTFRSVTDDKVLKQAELPDVSGHKGRAILEEFALTDLFYSFGRAHPGAIRLHNYPRHLQNLTRDDGEKLDLAAVDILRDRERGVPRYNRFRRLVHKEPVKSFEELTDNPVWREEIRRVYNDDIEQVDLMTGLYAEPLPDGFGFSETAFRIFVLMASRRLKSDRFFTDDFRPEIYTQLGIDWIKTNSMLTVLKRHFPGLAKALEGVDNAFKPWRAAQ
jgi:hypothetical protein